MTLTPGSRPAMTLRTWIQASMPTSMDNVAGVEVEHAGTDVQQYGGQEFDVRGSCHT